MLVLTGVGSSPSPGQLVSDNTPAGSGLVNKVPLRTGFIKKNKVIWYLSKWFLSPPPTGSPRDFSLQESAQAPGGKPRIPKGLPMTGAPLVFLPSELFALSVRQVTDYSLGFPDSALVPTLVLETVARTRPVFTFPSNPGSLLYLGRAGFSLCSTCCLWIRWSGNF